MEQKISNGCCFTRNNHQYWKDLLGEEHTNEIKTKTLMLNVSYHKTEEKRFFLNNVCFKSYAFETNEIESTTMYGSFFNSCDFEEASITFSFFHHCFFKDCKFVDCYLEHNEFRECIFINCVFESGLIYKADFNNCTFLSCNFSHICIEDVNFGFDKFIDVCVKGSEREYLISTDTIEGDLGSLIEIVFDFDVLGLPNFVHLPIKEKNEILRSVTKDIFSRDFLTVVRK